jgi:hypothetical protein
MGRSVAVAANRFRRETRHADNAASMASRRSSGLLTLLLYAFSSFSLPVRLAPEVFSSARAPVLPGAMTIGCPEASCCTSRCYLDEQGVHHCVPASGKSCGCGLSSGETSAGATLMADDAIIPLPERPMPDSPPALLACDVTPGPQSHATPPDPGLNCSA